MQSQGAYYQIYLGKHRVEIIHASGKMIIGLIILSLTGAVLTVIGFLVWKKEKISLLHDYHYGRVSTENKTAFCTLSGFGIISIGVGLLVTAVIMGITNSVWSFIAFAVGFLIGVSLLIYTGNKYNR